MAKGEMKNTKFRVKADLALFAAIQRNGRLSEGRIAREINIPATTVHYALERIRQRDFFDIKAVPRLERFREIPLAIMGFSHVHPARIQELRRDYVNAVEVVQFFHGVKDVLLFVMASSVDALTGHLFDIMERLDEKPCLYITCPTIAKSGVTIPDKVLDAVYAHLPDRRMRV
jgi:DNA-binding Lrp family transcriptional regulator